MAWLRYDKNELGTTISIHACDHCGKEFWICPAVTPESGKFNTCGAANGCATKNPELDRDDLPGIPAYTEPREKVDRMDRRKPTQRTLIPSPVQDSFEAGWVTTRPDKVCGGGSCVPRFIAVYTDDNELKVQLRNASFGVTFIGPQLLATMVDDVPHKLRFVGARTEHELKLQIQQGMMQLRHAVNKNQTSSSGDDETTPV